MAMTAAEYESKKLNIEQQTDFVNDLIDECEGPLILKNTAVAREYI